MIRIARPRKVLPRQSRRGRPGAKTMIRTSLYALAAVFSTLCVVSSTLAAMYAGTGAGIA